jgi:hypothetical protein
MNHIKAFIYRPEMSTDWLITIYFVFSSTWLLLVYLAWLGAVSTGALYFWFLFASLRLGVIGTEISKSVASGSTVLRKLRTPQSLGQVYLRTVLVHAVSIWLVFCIAGTVLLLSANFAWKSITAVALFSLILSISILTALPSKHVVVQVWRMFLYIAAFLMIPLMAWKGYPNVLDYALELPPWLIFIWPITVYIIAQKWKAQPAVETVAPQQPKHSLSAQLSAYTDRYTNLAFSFRKKSENQSFTSRLVSMLSTQYLSMYMLSLFSNSSWGVGISVYHIAGLAMVASLFCSNLIFKDLHWRKLLAPGCLHQRKLGWHIFSSSITLSFSYLLLGACIWALVAWCTFDVPFAKMMNTVWQYRAVPVQLMFACSLAIMVSAASTIPRANFILIGLAFLFAGLIFAAHGFSTRPSHMFSVGPAYFVSMLLATTTMILVSNHLWTRERLLRYMREN